jgi:hypothetical protein
MFPSIGVPPKLDLLGKPRKMPPLPGYVETQMTCCGKRSCRCARGRLHGPYFYRVWSSRGRRMKEYIRLAAVAEVIARCEARRKQQREARAALAELRGMRSLLREMREL